jgi:Uma2 family endonuclease
MGPALPKTKAETYTIAEYLAFEREATTRHEYIDGNIVAMAGESGEHADICVNLVGELRAQLKGTRCRVRFKDTKVRSSGLVSPKSRKGLFSYPDLVVICGEPSYHDEYRDVVINPAVIIEVLSPSTQEFDRLGKFARYRLWNPTLTDYVLVWQTAPIVEHYTRQENGDWRHRFYYRPDENLVIESIACSLPLAEIFDRVDFTGTGEEYLRLLPQDEEDEEAAD